MLVNASGSPDYAPSPAVGILHAASDPLPTKSTMQDLHGVDGLPVPCCSRHQQSILPSCNLYTRRTLRLAGQSPVLGD